MRTADPVRLERIFDSAVRLFAEGRYHEVRMDDIATRAGVSKGSLYNHFKDKEDLYLELISRGLNQLLQEVRKRIALSNEPEEKLCGFVQEITRFFMSHPHYLELIQIVKQTQCNADSIRIELLDLLVGIIRELDATKRWTVGDPEFAAFALIGMTREILLRRPTSSSDLAQRIVKLFLHGIGKS